MSPGRLFQRCAGLLCSAALAGGASAALITNITPGGSTIKLTRIGTAPVADNGVDALTYALGDVSRLYVSGRSGVIELVKDGVLQPTPWLNVKTSILSGSGGISVLLNSTPTDERGFLGLAFSPGFNNASSSGYGKFYTYTSETATGTSDFTHPEITGGTAIRAFQNVLREFTVTPGTDAATVSSSRVLFRLDKVQDTHNAGSLHFGPDGMLYISVGDGGGADDNNGGITSITDGHTNNKGNGQDTKVAYGKVLRIDPLLTGIGSTLSGNGQYGIPGTNPFVASSSGDVKEIFAYGLRNSVRFSFSPDGKLYLADVGQTQREEVDVVTVGANYGWPFNEGSLQNSVYATVRPGGFSDTQPLAEYTHADGVSVMGGFIYRGTKSPELTGKYIFGDYQGTTGAPRFFYMDPADGITHSFSLDASGIIPGASSPLYGFGEDASGNLYALMGNGDVLALSVPEPGMATALTAGLALAVLKRRRGAAKPPAGKGSRKSLFSSES